MAGYASCKPADALGQKLLSGHTESHTHSNTWIDCSTRTTKKVSKNTQYLAFIQTLCYVVWPSMENSSQTSAGSGTVWTACHTGTYLYCLKPYRHFFCLINTIPVCRMANAGHNACKSKDVHPEKDNFTVMRSEIFAENAQKSTWRLGSARTSWGAYRSFPAPSWI